MKTITTQGDYERSILDRECRALTTAEKIYASSGAFPLKTMPTARDIENFIMWLSKRIRQFRDPEGSANMEYRSGEWEVWIHAKGIASPNCISASAKEIDEVWTKARICAAKGFTVEAVAEFCA